MNQKLSFSTNPRWLIVTVLLSLAALSESTAQTSSAIDIIPSVTSTKEMVKACEWNNQSYLVCYSKGPGGHLFELINTATGAVRKVPFQIGTTGSVSMNGITGHQIYDMDVDEGYCYFCGAEGWFQQGVPSSIGFVGRFSVDEAINGSGQIDMIKVEATTLIKKIAVSGEGRLQIFALAEVPADPRFMTVYETFNTTCLVDLEELDGNMYSYIVAPANSSEVFTDLDMINGGVVVVSRFLRNHQSFCLRNMKDGNGPITDPYNWTTIQNGSIFANLSQPNTNRPEDAPILIDGDQRFIVAHSVDSNGVHGVATYRMELTNIGSFVMNSARLWPSADSESLLDLSTYSMDQAAVLTTNGSTYQIKDISTYGFGKIFSCASSSYRLSAVSSLINGRFHMAGHNSSNKFCYMSQAVSSSVPSCLNRFLAGNSSLRAMQPHASDELWIVQDQHHTLEISVNYTSSTTIHQNICNH